MTEGSITLETQLSMGVSDLAKAKLQEFLKDRSLDSVAVRISVQPGGCSGATYGMEFADGPEGAEKELTANGVRLLIDPAHGVLLNGIVVDYVDEMMGGGFKIHNPNATSTCGCGKSFGA